MKYDKSKKPAKSNKPKRQPDPILSKTVKVSGKLGSAQRKRMQKRLVSKFSKGKGKKGKKIEQVKGNAVEKKDDTSDVSMDEEENNNEAEARNLTVQNVNDPFNLNDDVDDDNVADDLADDVNDSDFDDEDESMEDLKESDEESIDEKMEDDEESIDEEDKNDEESIDEAEDDEEDIATNIQSGENTIKVTDLDSLNSRIQKNMEILSNFKEYKERNNGRCHPRSYYVDVWIGDLCDRFSYNKFLLYKLYQIFNANLFQFLVASDEDRPLTIRTNTLKTTTRQLSEVLTNKDCNVEKLAFSKVGMVVHSAKCSIGATSEYLAGYYILQGSSSMLPVMALAPKPGEKILDMCAAPGGKSTHIAQIMKNTGCLYVNDLDANRLKAVNGNLARMGVNNTLVINSDGRSIHTKLRNLDRVLVDAPCTGTGVISRDKSIKANKDESDLKILNTVQKQLLCSAVDACKVGGYVVYSTCSILVEENEQVVDYVCRKRNVKIVETGLFGTKGFVNFCSKHFNNHMDRTRRYYPHENNMDGFFVAKIQKLAKPTVQKEQRS